MQVWIGTSGWTYDHWRGLFYPAELPKNRWLSFYAEHFAVVEINATFYRKFGDQSYKNWRERTPPGFRFILKAPKVITHRKYLRDAEAEIQAFDRSASLLGEKLALVLLQLAPATPYDLELLRKALEAFSMPSKVAVEFRHKKWLTDELFGLLSELGVTFCNPDSPRWSLTDYLTSSALYLRLHGRQRWYGDNYGEQELGEVIRMIQQAEAKGASQAYVLFNNDFEGYAPANANKLREMVAGS